MNTMIRKSTVYDIKYHVIGITKYRYKVLNKQISSRLRELIRQGCEAINITIVRRKYWKRQRSYYLINKYYEEFMELCQYTFVYNNV